MHQEASNQAAAKKEVSAMHLKAMYYLSCSIDWSFHYRKTKFNQQIKSERKEHARIRPLNSSKAKNATRK